MGIKEKSGVESETWQESETEEKVFLQKNLVLETEDITIEKAHEIGEKEEGKIRIIVAKFLKLQTARESVKQIQGAEIMGGSNLRKRKLQRVYY